jgi:hypothetical protein
MFKADRGNTSAVCPLDVTVCLQGTLQRMSDMIWAYLLSDIAYNI